MKPVNGSALFRRPPPLPHTESGRMVCAHPAVIEGAARQSRGVSMKDGWAVAALCPPPIPVTRELTAAFDPFLPLGRVSALGSSYSSGRPRCRRFGTGEWRIPLRVLAASPQSPSTAVVGNAAVADQLLRKSIGSIVVPPCASSSTMICVSTCRVMSSPVFASTTSKSRPSRTRSGAQGSSFARSTTAGRAIRSIRRSLEQPPFRRRLVLPARNAREARQ